MTSDSVLVTERVVKWNFLRYEKWIRAHLVEMSSICSSFTTTMGVEVGAASSLDRLVSFLHHGILIVEGGECNASMKL